jgi:hypothetical protein
LFGFGNRLNERDKKKIAGGQCGYYIFLFKKKNEDATCREDARLTGDELG